MTLKDTLSIIHDSDRSTIWCMKMKYVGIDDCQQVHSEFYQMVHFPGLLAWETSFE